jgi:hypothetical protein
VRFDHSGRRLAGYCAALCVFTVIAVLSIAGTAAASGTATNISSFTDPRGALDNSKPGQLTRVLYGPYTIPAASSSNNMMGQIHNAVDNAAATPCGGTVSGNPNNGAADCRITDIIPSLVTSSDGINPTGTANLSDGVMLHHFVFFNPQSPDVTCPGAPFVGTFSANYGQRFFASGNERSELHLPMNFGYDNQRATWNMVYHLVNFNTTQKTVYIQVVYKWRNAAANDTRPATPVWLDIDSCQDSEYTIDPGYSDATWNWTNSLPDGYVLGIGGHQHDIDLTSQNQADRCLSGHCFNEGGARAVSAEIVGGDSNTYYGPLPTNNSPPGTLTGATLCRSEAYHGTSDYGDLNGYNNHLDTMSGCGDFDVPNTRQPEAYPTNGAYADPGFFLPHNAQIRLHSEYDNLTSGQQTDVMGIMMMWVADLTQFGYPRPSAGAQLRVPLAIANRQCGAGGNNPNRSHSGGLAFPSCNPPAQTSNYLTVGTSDANGFTSQGSGFVKMTTCANGTTTTGICSTPSGMTAPDVRLELSTTDVRCKAGVTTCEGGALSDYTGQVQVNANLRITDKHNSSTPGGTGDSATVQDNPYTFTAPCTANPAGGSATAIGATCSVVTRANAVNPGAVVAGKRTVWELGQIKVNDGGADGQVSTGPNTLFETQGIFVP